MGEAIAAGVISGLIVRGVVLACQTLFGTMRKPREGENVDRWVMKRMLIFGAVYGPLIGILYFSLEEGLVSTNGVLVATLVLTFTGTYIGVSTFLHHLWRS